MELTLPSTYFWPTILAFEHELSEKSCNTPNVSGTSTSRTGVAKLPTLLYGVGKPSGFKNFESKTKVGFEGAEGVFVF